MQATDEDLADLARVMNARGYLVMISYVDYVTGQILDGRNGALGRIDQPLCVMAKTDRADFMEQYRLSGWGHALPWKGDERFYRVTTD